MTKATPLNIRKILATTDFSDQSQSGVRYAVELAEKLGGSIDLLHVIDPPSRLAGMEAVVLVRGDSDGVTLSRRALLAKWVALAHAQLATLAKRESKGAVAVTTSLRIGKPFDQITTAARAKMADLIVIATHGYTGVEHVLLGSTAERVVRHAPCPVLTVSTRGETGRIDKTAPFKLRKILVPIDFSTLSKDALPWATHLAALFGAELVLLSIVEKFPIDYFLGPEVMNEANVPLMKQAKEKLERMAGRLNKSTGVRVSAVVSDGKPFEEICHVARTQGADLIVLTTHGYAGLKHVWLGSTAERVVRHAPCPVLAVREKDQKT